MNKKKFILAVSFTNLSLEKTRAVLAEWMENQTLSALGFWHIFKDEVAEFALINGEKVALNRDAEIADEHEKYSYALTVVSPLLTIDEIGKASIVFRALYDAGALVTSTDCLKIYFLNKYSRWTARKVVERIVPWNELFYTSLFFPYPLNAYSHAEVEQLEATDGVKIEQLFNNLREDVYACYRFIINGIICCRNDNPLPRFMVNSFLGHIGPGTKSAD